MYRLIVSITRGTNAGRALSMMASGTQCSADSLDYGTELYDNYLDAATAVLRGCDKGICFGIVALVHTKDGVIVKSHVLMS